MPAKAAFVWRDDLTSYRLSDTHPLNPIRLEATLDLLQTTGVLRADDVVSCEPASEATIGRVHDEEYIRMVKYLGRKDPEQLSLSDKLLAATYGFGTGDNPVFRAMHDASALVTGASVQAARLVMSGRARRACNIAGGLHHAFRARAAGFCVYNDAAVAIAHIRAHDDARVAYIDIDAHHGDGVQEIFYDDADVLTVSIHESGHHLFPGTGHITEQGHGAAQGTAVNIPLAPETGDASWIDCFETIVPAVLRKFKPDVLVTQHGCDAHHWDPLTHLAASTRALERAAVVLRDLADELCAGRWVALGGGGYDLFRSVPRVWTALWAVLAERDLPDEVPPAWLRRWRAAAAARGTDLPLLMRDEADAFADAPVRAEAAERNRVLLHQLLDRLAIG